MPKTVFDRYAENEIPEIDWLMAAVLERLWALNFTYKDLADACGVNYCTMRKYMNRRSAYWPSEVREHICDFLGIKASWKIERKKFREEK